MSAPRQRVNCFAETRPAGSLSLREKPGVRANHSKRRTGLQEMRYARARPPCAGGSCSGHGWAFSIETPPSWQNPTSSVRQAGVGTRAGAIGTRAGGIFPRAGIPGAGAGTVFPGAGGGSTPAGTVGTREDGPGTRAGTGVIYGSPVFSVE